MKVKELIELLSKHDPEMEVLIPANFRGEAPLAPPNPDACSIGKAGQDDEYGPDEGEWMELSNAGSDHPEDLEGWHNVRNALILSDQ